MIKYFKLAKAVCGDDIKIGSDNSNKLIRYVYVCIYDERVFEKIDCVFVINLSHK